MKSQSQQNNIAHTFFSGIFPHTFGVTGKEFSSASTDEEKLGWEIHHGCTLDLNQWKSLRFSENSLNASQYSTTKTIRWFYEDWNSVNWNFHWISEALTISGWVCVLKNYSRNVIPKNPQLLLRSKRKKSARIIHSTYIICSFWNDMNYRAMQNIVEGVLFFSFFYLFNTRYIYFFWKTKLMQIFNRKNKIKKIKATAKRKIWPFRYRYRKLSSPCMVSGSWWCCKIWHHLTIASPSPHIIASPSSNRQTIASSLYHKRLAIAKPLPHYRLTVASPSAHHCLTIISPTPSHRLIISPDHRLTRLRDRETNPNERPEAIPQLCRAEPR